MLYYGIWNSQEKKYGMEPTNNLLTHNMTNSFENMCEIYDSLIELVHFFIYAIMYIILSIIEYILITFYFMPIDWHENMEWNEVSQRNISNNLGTISP